MSKQGLDILHVPEEELVRLLDEELRPGRRSEVVDHVFGCGECSERMAELTHASQWFASYLARIDAEAEVDELARARALAAMRRASTGAAAPRTAQRRSIPLARAAAIVGVFIVTGLFVPPVRAWVAERIGFASRAAPEEVVVTEEVGLPVAGTSSTISFRPNDALFRFELEHPQVGGSITVEGTEGSLASARILGGGAETILILPGGLRIGNAPASAVDYRLHLPVDLVTEVRILVGGTMVAEFDHPASGATRRLDLAAPPASR
jgi:hypothetical protein